MLSMAVFFLRPRGLSTSKKANQNKLNDWQREGEGKNIIFSRHSIQLNLSTTVTLGTEESGHCKVVAVVGRSEI